jgi:hypothetical protein
MKTIHVGVLFAALLMGLAGYMWLSQPASKPIDIPPCPTPVPTPLPPESRVQPARMPESLISDWRVGDLKQGETRWVSQSDVVVLLKTNNTYIDLEGYTYNDEEAKKREWTRPIKVSRNKEGNFTIQVPKGVAWNRRTKLYGNSYFSVVEITQEK